MAKKKDVNIDELDDESGKSGKLVSILVAMLIIVIWLVIFALLIKMNVGGIGSSLRPYLKNVPVVNKILPAATDEEIQEETGGKYKSLSEAVDRIKELEAQLVLIRKRLNATRLSWHRQSGQGAVRRRNLRFQMRRYISILNSGITG